MKNKYKKFKFTDKHGREIIIHREMDSIEEFKIQLLELSFTNNISNVSMYIDEENFWKILDYYND